MDKRTEENIAKMAFGDLSEAQAAEVRAQVAANQDAKKALDSYEALRADLRMLRDVPPDQLSKERLRNAILKDGLNPKPVKRGFPWLGTVAASAVAAMGLFVVVKMNPSAPREKGSVEPVAFEYGGNKLGSSDLLTSTLNVDDQNLVNGLINFNEGSSASAPVPAATAPVAKVQPSDGGVVNSEPVAIYSPRHSSYRTHVQETYRGGDDSSARNAIFTMSATPAADVAAKSIDTPKKSSETLVLIQSNKDSDTGASSAVEVHQTADVIVSS